MTDPIKLKREETHKKIDDTFNLMIKNMGNIFEKIKFNDVQVVEETNNLEIITSVDSISARLNDLVNVVYDMKLEHLKKTEYDNMLKKKNSNDLYKINGDLNKKIIQLQEFHNFINTNLKENKQNKFYRYSMNYNFDKI
jgi:hypothetical protein